MDRHQPFILIFICNHGRRTVFIHGGCMRDIVLFERQFVYRSFNILRMPLETFFVEQEETGRSDRFNTVGSAEREEK